MKFIKTLLLLSLTSCAQQSDMIVEDIDLSTSFITQGESELDINWWRSFNNTSLTTLINQGLQDNLSLKAREIRLKSNAISTQIARTDLYPTLNLATSASSNFNENPDLSLGFNSSWELDLWGRIESNVNKFHWNHQEQLALYRGRANLVAGSITNAWLGLIFEQEKHLLLAKQFQRTQDALKVISRRFAMGKISVTNIWQQQKLLKSIEVEQHENKADLINYQQALALWLAIPANELVVESNQAIPLLPELPQMGIPAQVLKHRPDIEQAFAKIKAADEAVAIAISNQYPRITFRADYSTSTDSSMNLFDDWSGNLVNAIAMPLFDSGERKSVVQQRKLELQALLLDYKQIWLDAIATVNQVLMNEEQLLMISENIEAQLVIAERTEKLTSMKYLNGKTNYLDLLKAQESILSLEREKIDANKKVMINRVLLYRELSHGEFSIQSINQGTQS